ncbi:MULTISPECIES: ABC transporter permease [Variovorax]|uniref:ABC transporter permease n=1 Tax=Variovorax TaxID=34072 RepID=UPI00086B5BAB|nr:MULTISPECIES: iron ABC transporter permease [Variovorax]MBN8754601.1 iron ABC transporter permease [Variovorax sp.]ODU19326.1 MAG: ABC transporter permease [Variovorax sp. SCN 67-85]ODV25228.1 MAG: ABC transporter permease [Variovorax sp. SCN 67-20]OJZ03047.1 MAG: ABC transporter permease [Variovorax sp. 67-131]UKI08123.1 iron ABC transporter permease [Variovorax paradoxus]
MRARIPNRMGDPAVWLFGTLILLLILLVANPILRLIWDSFHTADGTLSFSSYAAALGRSRNLQALLNSFYLGVAVTAIAIALGVPLALAVSRTNMPARGFTHVSVLAAFVMPNFLGAIAWILLAGPNAGWLNRLWSEVLGTDRGPFNIFSFWGLAFVIALYTYPLIYVFTKSALDLVSTELEDAASIHGAGKLRTLTRVTLPLVLPSIVGAAILIFLESVALYGTPALIAIPAGLNLATTQIVSFFEYPLKVEQAAAFSMPILALTVVMLYLQRRLLARKGFVSVSGKGGERRPFDVGAWKWVLLGYSALVSLLTVVMPLIILVLASLSKAWGRGFSAGNLTFANFYNIFFEQLTVRSALVNTVTYSAVTALVCVAMGMCVAYATQRRITPFPTLIQFLALAPVAVPGLILAIGLYAAYAGPPFSLYGTGALVVVAFTTRFLPIAVTACGAGVRSLNPELEEAVRILGGGRLTALGKVVVPLLNKTLVGAFILVFVICTKELSTAVFLTGPASRVVSVLTLDLSEQGNYESLAAMGVVLVVIVTLVVGIGMRIAGRDFMLRRS